MMSSGMAATLPRLREETELQKMLADQKMAFEQLKNNYQTLKVEHSSVEDAYILIQEDLKKALEEARLCKERDEAKVRQLQTELATSFAERDELKSQVLTSQRVEMIKLQVQEEVEAPFREKFHRLESELELYRNENNKFKYDYGFLKTEYEHAQKEHAREREEMMLRHEAEVSNLRKERQCELERQQQEGSQDQLRVRTLQKENAMLHLRLKSLTSEMEEVRAQKEHTGMQSDSVLRLQQKQLAEHAANVKSLETEKDSLRQQVASLQREVNSTGEQNTHLTTRIHDLEKECLQLRSRSDETHHKSRVELTNLKMEEAQKRGELERERDKLHNQMLELKSTIEIQQHTINQQLASIKEKDREASKKVEAALQEEWTKLHVLEADKMSLETKLQETERRKIDEEGQRHAEREKWEDRLRQVQEAKESAEKEALVYKTKVSHQESLLAQLERERSENSELKTRLHRIETQYQTYVSSEQEFIDINERLKNQVSELREDLRLARDEATRVRTEYEASTRQHRSEWAEERGQLQKQSQELQTQHTELQTTHNAMLVASKKRKRKVTSVVSRLQDKVQIQKAKIEQLKAQSEVLKKCVPAETHLQLKKQLRDLIRRHQEFRALLMANGQLKEVTIGDKIFASVGIPVMGNCTFADADDQFSKDVERVKERLDMLNNQQVQQMSDLRPISPISAPRKKPPAYSPLTSDQVDTDTDRDTTDDKENLPSSTSSPVKVTSS